MKRRYFAIPLLLLALALIILVQTASNRIASPDRALLHDRHYHIMTNPAEHGMKLSAHTAPDGTPYYLCEGTPQIGTKGLLLRQQLSDRKIPLSQKPAALLLLHGHGSRKEHHLAIAERFCAAGFTCIIPDLPGHGEHPHKKATFGKNEVPLLLNFTKQIRQEHLLPEKIGLFGLSQGGAIALQLAAAQSEEFHSVATISTFSNLANTLERTAESKSFALATLVPIVTLDLKLRHGLSPQKISPALAATQVTIPSFIVHGENDTFVPPKNALTIFKNLPPSQRKLRLIPKAGHGNVLAKGELIYADLCEFYLNASS